MTSIRSEGRDGNRGRMCHLLSTRCRHDKKCIQCGALYSELGSFVNPFIWVTV